MRKIFFILFIFYSFAFSDEIENNQNSGDLEFSLYLEPKNDDEILSQKSDSNNSDNGEVKNDVNFVLDENLEDDFISQSLKNGYKLYDPDNENGVIAVYGEDDEDGEVMNISNDNEIFKIGILLPQDVIAGYANDVVNAVTAFVLAQNIQAKILTYYCGNESENSIVSALSRIASDNVNFVIAPLSVAGVRILADNSEFSTIYFIPTINEIFAPFYGDNIYFGGVDYSAQIQYLVPYFTEKTSVISDTSTLGKFLSDNVYTYADIVQTYILKGARNSFFENVDKIEKDSSFLLNLSTQKAGSVISELNNKKLNVKNILSTQINYDAKLLENTTKNEQKNLYIASSVNKIPKDILDMSSFFGVDLRYNKVAYAAVLGVDYFYAYFGDMKYKRVFSEEIYDNQIRYNTYIYRCDGDKFLFEK